jgi:site-specific recombinase
MMHHTMESALETIAAAPSSADPAPLVALVNALRPARGGDAAAAATKLYALTFLLANRHEFRTGLRAYLLHLVATCRPVHLYANTGIQSLEGFGRELLQQFAFRILPPALDHDSLSDILRLVFWKGDDWRWLEGVPLETWEELLGALAHRDGADQIEQQDLKAVRLSMLEAIQVISYRVAAIGLDPEFLRNEPALEEHESPFVGQQIETRRYVVGYRQWLVDPDHALEDDRQIEVLIDQCDRILNRIHNTAQRKGTSVRLTYLWLVQRQFIERMRILLRLVDPEAGDATARLVIAFALDLALKSNRKHSLRDFIGRNTQLLALRVTEHAGKTGEHYVAHDRLEYRAMMWSAMGAGLVVACMALSKIGIMKLQLPPLIETFFVCMNYAFGFMLIHVLHFTLATKQPAMTANLIALTISSAPDSRRSLDHLAELVVKVARTQLIGIIGNVVVAFPVAWLIARALGWMLGHPVASAAKAEHLLHDLDPVASLALFHAAIAGLWLFAAGLISGYYDNKAQYNRIPQRIRQLRLPARLLGQARLDRLASYVENNLGALAGNFFFGVLLGITALIGFLVGLPLDIRHVTFAAANFAYGLALVDHEVSWHTIAVCMLGIAAIGLVNLVVSFSLAIYVAMRSRRATWSNWQDLLRRLLRLFRERPGEFFLPPKAA